MIPEKPIWCSSKNLQKRFRPNLGLFVTLWLPEEARKGAWAIAIYGQCDSSMALNVATWGCNDNLNVLGHFRNKCVRQK